MGVIGSKAGVKKIESVPLRERNDKDEAAEVKILELGKSIQTPNTRNTDIPITEAEKLRHIYKKEQASGLTAANTSKKDEVKTKHRQHYKTSDFHDSGRQNTKKNLEKKHAVLKTSEINAAAKDTSAKRLSKSTGNSTGIATQSSHKSQKQNFVRDLDGYASSTSSHFTNSFSQHCPDLMAQSKLTYGALRPLSKGKLGIEKGQLRNELEKQGILGSENYSPSNQVDPKQEGIICALKEVGIINKVTAYDVYSMSSGAPKRRPPPRLGQLPRIDVDQEIKKAEVNSKNADPSGEKDGSKLCGKEIRVPKAEIDDNESEYFGKLGEENVGDAGKLKLKLIDVDIM